ncbi:3,4-dihydroxy-2-butanone-4-phosphate synthase [Halogeometricum borinquense]|uniref:3,4-dihydroxy-2-butanone 4-phosphate synthase n=1 Tax=Halogeometricum borinquense TaxID=60847 RepID=A0A6C0UCK8_9EURY|nr:3,4-dihydroxy-2-butanone-4-phosphate synthase [Halogeometricum borinquense]QIB73044.1 3,4-dihydroxy-2-butanone-4-phosphate synthase [Halogeometricum borinquense]QIQ77556.1 3,4-dihydroxy-2-butanone-4-phosphate synthase [Halogeometricum borinquense]
MVQRTDDALSSALSALSAGEPILVHDFDDREGETDVVYPAGAVEPADVARLRNDAGGLVCVALSHEVSEELGLPFLDGVIDHPTAADHELAYDDRSSFSLPVNHRDTFTGITDEDRALTITELSAAAERVLDGDYGADDFAAEFRSPGHVNLLRGAPNLLSDRQGHTELGLALAAEADLPAAVVVCEMLDDESGTALSPAAALDYANRHDLVYVEGMDVVERLA